VLNLNDKCDRAARSSGWMCVAGGFDAGVALNPRGCLELFGNAVHQKDECGTLRRGEIAEPVMMSIRNGSQNFRRALAH
jgi:hypothetical protein